MLLLNDDDPNEGYPAKLENYPIVLKLTHRVCTGAVCIRVTQAATGEPRCYEGGQPCPSLSNPFIKRGRDTILGDELTLAVLSQQGIRKQCDYEAPFSSSASGERARKGFKAHTGKP